MFYDLNVPYSPTDTHHLPRTLAFLAELGYNAIALNHSISGKLPAHITCAIPSPLPLPSHDTLNKLPANFDILRRVTLTLTESYQNARLAELSRSYDILAVRPVDERTFQLACGSLDCDIISLDLTHRLPFFFKHKMLSEAVRSGKRFEICYSQGLLGDSSARRNLISNATQLIRASRGRGLIISSEARAAVGCRGPWCAINLATIWGLGQERGFEAMSKEARSVVVSARLKRTGYRGVIDVVYGGEKPAALPPKKEEQVPSGAKGKGKQNASNGQKRKAEVLEGDAVAGVGEKPISKREAKRRAKEGRVNAVGGDNDAVAGSADAAATEQGNDQAVKAAVAPANTE